MQTPDPRSRTIFITGAGAGIGAATARLFASHGWSIGGCDLDLARLDQLRHELDARAFAPYVADVRDRAAVTQAIDAFAALHGGRLDAVFANAGVLFMGPHASLASEQTRLLVDVNVHGVLHTFDAALPYLRNAAPGARAIAMCSTSAEYGSPHHAVYGATKFFVRGLTEALDLEWRREGIRVSGIYVSYVRTGMVLDANWRPASIDALGVNASAEQVADAVWRAVHGARAHWRVGFDARLTHFAARLLGAWIAPVYARLMKL